MARQAPRVRAAERDTIAAKAGNYMAPVDTAGMDSAMKHTLKSKKNKPTGMSLIDKIKRKLGIQY